MNTTSLPRLLLVFGFTVGLITAAIGVKIPAFLALAPGIVLFVIVAAVVALRKGPLMLRPSIPRVLLAAITSGLAYILALLIYMGIANYLPEIFGFQSSDQIRTFGVEIWVGLLVAGLFAAAGMTVAVFVILRRWSAYTFLKLAVAASTTIGVSCFLTLGGLRISGLQATDWFASPLLIFSMFPIGYALFSLVLGIELTKALTDARAGGPPIG